MKNERIKKLLTAGFVTVFWIILWQLLAVFVNKKVILPTPFMTLKALLRMMSDGEFYLTLLTSVSKILLGFFLGLLGGIIFAVLSYNVSIVRKLLTPMIRLIKAVPVASFVILVLLWVESKNLSVIVVFLMVLPISYTNLLTGLDNLSKELLEMAKVFRMRSGLKYRFIYFPELLPQIFASISVGLGFAIKSGVAAEVIGLPNFSLGRLLYDSKLYLMSDELFAITVVIVIISFVLEKVVLLLLNKLRQRLINFSLKEETLNSGIDDFKEYEKISENEVAEKSGNKVEKASGNESSVSKEEKMQNGNDTDDSAQKGTVVSVKNISKSFKAASEFDVFRKNENKKVVFDNFSYTFNDGITCLTGPSGSGKTTLFRLLSGLETLDSGSIEGTSEKTAYVFQENRLIENASALTNIQVVNPLISVGKIFESMELVGLDKENNQAVSTYSGGMKRRVAIIRTMLSDAALLLLDEPFTGLDEDSKKKTADFIKKERCGRTMVVALHNSDEAELLGSELIRLSGE
ncbi:MAG: ATP-binding cassette domain-containing protein [Lachnospiraceae bacterium]|nr:ATP-binding cassette domain-containing protein [Lachnospiraceae bacterium]